MSQECKLIRIMNWNCGNCGAEIEYGTKFCPNCGANINWDESEITYTCNNCGEKFKGKVAFCPHCGTEMNYEMDYDAKNYKNICGGILCVIAFVFVFLWGLANDSDDGGGLYTYISGASVLAILGIATLIFLERIKGSDAVKTTIGIAIYFIIMLINVPIASEELSNKRKAAMNPAIEQKQESPAEKAARKKEEKQRMIDKMMKDAFAYGKSQAMQFTYYQDCDMWFRSRWFTPETDEELSIYKRYKAEYDKGWDEGKRIKAKMDNI